MVNSALCLPRKSSFTKVNSGFLTCASLEFPPFEPPSLPAYEGSPSGAKKRLFRHQKSRRVNSGAKIPLFLHQTCSASNSSAKKIPFLHQKSLCENSGAKIPLFLHQTCSASNSGAKKILFLHQKSLRANSGAKIPLFRHQKSLPGRFWGISLPRRQHFSGTRHVSDRFMASGDGFVGKKSYICIF